MTIWYRNTNSSQIAYTKVNYQSQEEKDLIDKFVALLVADELQTGKYE
jgi:hypothetical protein